MLKPSESNITGILLTGGKSSRMGEPKVNLLLEGKSFGEKSIELLQQFCSEIVISQNEFLFQSDYKSISDSFFDIGPIAGLHAGLKYCKTDWLFVLACDIPFMDIETINLLRSSEKNEAVICFKNDGFFEPLCAFYHKSFFANIERSILQENYSLQKILSENKICGIELTDNQKYRINNINTKQIYESFIKS